MPKKNQRAATEQAMGQLRIASKALKPKGLTPTVQLAYERYKKRIGKAGGKIATPEQFRKIQQRLTARKGITRRKGRRKSTLGLDRVTPGLKQAEVDEKTIARLRGKKK